MNKTDLGIFKLLDDMRISSERILATLEGQTRESFLDSEASWPLRILLQEGFPSSGRPRLPCPENTLIFAKNTRKYHFA